MEGPPPPRTQMYDWETYARQRRQGEQSTPLSRPPPPNRGDIVWKCHPDGRYRDEDNGFVCTWAQQYGPKDHWCMFENGDKAVVDLEQACERTKQIPYFIPTRKQYENEKLSARYPYMPIHQRDPYGEEYLEKLRTLFVRTKKDE